MRSNNNYALPSLLLLFFFLSNEAQGIRLGNGMIKLVGQLEKTLEEEVGGFRKTTLCENGHCNSGNNNRKLLTVTSPIIPSSPTPSTMNNNEEGNYKKGKSMSSNKEEPSVEKKDNLENSEAVSKNLEAGLELIDIAEMDYSPAKRKPPIHN